MSTKISTELVKEEKKLDLLYNKSVAIDILPYLYKYLYTLAPNKKDILKNSKGVATAHLKGFLDFLVKVKKEKIKLVVCMDYHINPLKQAEIERRKSSRKSKLDQLKLLEESKVILSEKQKKQKINVINYIGIEEKFLIKHCCTLLGISVYEAHQVEGEKAVAALKNKGLVDFCMSLDRDVIMYGTSFISEINFIDRTFIYYDLEKTLEKLALNLDELCCAAICVGTDYSKGLYKVGPKKIQSLLKEPDILQKRIAEEILNYAQIWDYLKAPLVSYAIIKKKPNTHDFINFLSQQGFTENSIEKYSKKLF